MIQNVTGWNRDPEALSEADMSPSLVLISPASVVEQVQTRPVLTCQLAWEADVVSRGASWVPSMRLASRNCLDDSFQSWLFLAFLGGG